jgi:hypothetical protein
LHHTAAATAAAANLQEQQQEEEGRMAMQHKVLRQQTLQLSQQQLQQPAA